MQNLQGLTQAQICARAAAPLTKVETLLPETMVYGTPKYGGDTNLISNGGFDSSTTGWTPVDCTILSVGSGVSGNCLEITPTGGTLQYAFQSLSGLTTGATYSVAFYVMQRVGAEAFAVQVYGGTQWIWISGTASDTWTLYSGVFTATQSTAAVLLIKNSSSSNLMLFDSIVFVLHENTYGGDWTDLASIDGQAVHSNISVSLAGAKSSPNPVAGSWAVDLVPPTSDYLPFYSSATRPNVFKPGRQFRLHTGVTVSGTDYYWQQITGFADESRFSGPMFACSLAGMDKMKRLADTQLRSPENYYGSKYITSTVAGTYSYTIPSPHKGAYLAVLDGTTIFSGNDWSCSFEPKTAVVTFNINPDRTLTTGSGNLEIYTFLERSPTGLVADILVAAGLYGKVTDATAAMHTEAVMGGGSTAIQIYHPFFEAGTSCLEAIRRVCEFANYRFWFDYSGTPHFLPAPTAKGAGSEDAVFAEGDYANLVIWNYTEEFWNHVVIEGEEKSPNTFQQNAVADRYRSEARDTESINTYGERTLTINNYFFQGQYYLIGGMLPYYYWINAQAAALLAAYKTPKIYFSFDLMFNPLPLEIGDTIKITVLIEEADNAGGSATTTTVRGLIRDIKVNGYSQSYVCEKVT